MDQTRITRRWVCGALVNVTLVSRFTCHVTDSEGPASLHVALDPDQGNPSNLKNTVDSGKSKKSDSLVPLKTIAQENSVILLPTVPQRNSNESFFWGRPPADQHKLEEGWAFFGLQWREPADKPAFDGAGSEWHREVCNQVQKILEDLRIFGVVDWLSKAMKAAEEREDLPPVKETPWNTSVDDIAVGSCLQGIEQFCLQHAARPVERADDSLRTGAVQQEVESFAKVPRTSAVWERFESAEEAFRAKILSSRALLRPFIGLVGLQTALEIFSEKTESALIRLIHEYQYVVSALVVSAPENCIERKDGVAYLDAAQKANCLRLFLKNDHSLRVFANSREGNWTGERAPMLFERTEEYAYKKKISRADVLLDLLRSGRLKEAYSSRKKSVSRLPPRDDMIDRVIRLLTELEYWHPKQEWTEDEAKILLAYLTSGDSKAALSEVKRLETLPSSYEMKQLGRSEAIDSLIRLFTALKYPHPKTAWTEVDSKRLLDHLRSGNYEAAGSVAKRLEWETGVVFLKKVEVISDLLAFLKLTNEKHMNDHLKNLLDYLRSGDRDASRTMANRLGWKKGVELIDDFEAIECLKDFLAKLGYPLSEWTAAWSPAADPSSSVYKYLSEKTPSWRVVASGLRAINKVSFKSPEEAAKVAVSAAEKTSDFQSFRDFAAEELRKEITRRVKSAWSSEQSQVVIDWV